jgi:hypothetical protein
MGNVLMGGEKDFRIATVLQHAVLLMKNLNMTSNGFSFSLIFPLSIVFVDDNNFCSSNNIIILLML